MKPALSALARVMTAVKRDALGPVISRARARQLLASDGDSTPQERLDHPPSPTDRPSAALAVGTVALFSIMAVIAGGLPNTPGWALALLVGTAVLAVTTGSPAARHLTLLCLLTAMAYRIPGFGEHPFPLVSALMGYGIVVFLTPSLRESVGWLHSGSFEPAVRRLVVVVALTSCAGLAGWHLLVDSDVTGAQARFADVPVWTIPAVGLAFAAVKAAAEEAAFRGVVMDALRSSVGVTSAVVLQAAVFGLVHYAHGVPRGMAGAVMSGVYGLALGVIRLRSRGMLAPWVTHALTNLAAFVLVVGSPMR